MAEFFNVLPPGDSISAANGIGSRSQGRFFFDDLELSPGGPRRRVFLRQRTLRVEVIRRTDPEVSLCDPHKRLTPGVLKSYFRRRN
jgi:hypothetical protein